ncbi:hypothetical protein AbraIFM66950_006791 [Aspergillus brasiliensis]|nr:hypothetical protein AbraIFM66950_006791 [Aspergillus brasiliensis]
MSGRITDLDHALFGVHQPFLLVESTHGDEERDHRQSRYNIKYWRFVPCLLRQLQQTARVPFSEVTVLTPYIAQGNAYRALLAQLHLEDPSVGYNLVKIKTIDSFQGGEASVVLYDTTATYGPGH